MKAFTTITFVFILVQSASCQMKQDIANYIARYKTIALEEMVRCKIPASITLAQGLHESGYGKSKLTTEANNHFGIKCKEEWDGKKYFLDDDAPQECFRVYDHAEDSYADHSDFLITRSRYAGLFELPITDYKAWATGLKSSGYATNPKYADILIKTIEDNNLTQYDQLGLAMIDAKEKLLSPGAENPTVATASTETIAEPAKPAKKEKETKETILLPAKSVNSTADAQQKTFIVNGAKVIKAQGVVDPLAIAFKYEIQYTLVLAYNDMNEGDKFKDGENIFLQSKRARAAEAQYKVQAGESMHDVSQKFGIRLKELYQKNVMVLNDQPVAGEVLYLQDKRTQAPRTMAYSDFLKTLNNNDTKASISNSSTGASTSADNTVPALIKNSLEEQHMQYKVGPSDTLYSIAKKFNTTVQQLEAINKLNSPDLHPGQTLVVAQ